MRMGILLLLELCIHIYNRIISFQKIKKQIIFPSLTSFSILYLLFI